MVEFEFYFIYPQNPFDLYLSWCQFYMNSPSGYLLCFSWLWLFMSNMKTWGTSITGNTNLLTVRTSSTSWWVNIRWLLTWVKEELLSIVHQLIILSSPFIWWVQVRYWEFMIWHHLVKDIDAYSNLKFTIWMQDFR